MRHVLNSNKIDEEVFFEGDEEFNLYSLSQNQESIL